MSKSLNARNLCSINSVKVYYEKVPVLVYLKVE